MTVFNGRGHVVDMWAFDSTHGDRVYVVATRIGVSYVVGLVRAGLVNLAPGFDVPAVTPAGAFPLAVESDDAARETAEHFARAMVDGLLPYHPTSREDEALWMVSALLIPAIVGSLRKSWLDR